MSFLVYFNHVLSLFKQTHRFHVAFQTRSSFHTYVHIFIIHFFWKIYFFCKLYFRTNEFCFCKPKKRTEVIHFMYRIMTSSYTWRNTLRWCYLYMIICYRESGSGEQNCEIFFAIKKSVYIVFRRLIGVPTYVNRLFSVQ